MVFFYGRTSTLLSAPAEDNTLIENNLSKEYLYKLPVNDYILGPGDSVRVIISRDYLELTTFATIDGSGTIYLPKLNRIYIEGLTLEELNSLLNNSYKEFVKYPAVEVEVINYRPIRVFIEGEVERPGLQTMKGSLGVNDLIIQTNETLLDKRENGLSNFKITDNNVNQQGTFNNTNSVFFPTVFDALRQSGGITRYSDLSNVQVIRKNSKSKGGGLITTYLNFEKALEFGDNTQNIRIFDSDIIKVSRTEQSNDRILRRSILSNLNPRFVNVFVTGRVRDGGMKVVSKASVLNDAIDVAGGAKFLKGKVRFIRFNNDGSIDKRNIKYSKRNKRSSYSNPSLQEGDLIVVGESFFSTSSEVISEFTSPFQGLFSTYGLFKAITE